MEEDSSLFRSPLFLALIFAGWESVWFDLVSFLDLQQERVVMRRVRVVFFVCFALACLPFKINLVQQDVTEDGGNTNVDYKARIERRGKKKEK